MSQDPIKGNRKHSDEDNRAVKTGNIDNEIISSIFLFVCNTFNSLFRFVLILYL